MFARKKTNSKQAEVNLVPFIDLLSVCICFMLLAAVWLQSGVLTTKQGFGTESTNKQKSLWVEVEGKGIAVVSIDNKNKQRINLKGLFEQARRLKEKNQDLTSAVILPSLTSNYEDLVSAMNSLKKAEFIDVGVSPL